MASRPPPNYIPNPNPNPNQNILVNVQIFGHVGAPPPPTATSGPISRPGLPPAALPRRSIRSNGAPVGPPNGPPSMIRAPLAQSFRGPTHGSPPPNQSSNAPPGRPTSASNMANQNLNPVSQPLQRQTQQTQQRRGGMSGVIPPVRMGPAAMGQQPMTPPHAGAVMGYSPHAMGQQPMTPPHAGAVMGYSPHAGAQQNNAIRRLNRPRRRTGGEPSIRNRVVQPRKKTLSDLLQEHALPPGLFPKDITDFQFDKKTRNIVITMPNDIWDLNCKSGVLRFSKTVTGLLERGKLSEINGMITQTLAYAKIREIKNKEQSEQPKWLHFKTDQGPLTRPFLDFKDVKNGQLAAGAKI